VCPTTSVLQEYDLTAYHSSEEEREERARHKSGFRGSGVDWGGVGRRARESLRSQLEQMAGKKPGQA